MEHELKHEFVVGLGEEDRGCLDLENPERSEISLDEGFRDYTEEELDKILKEEWGEDWDPQRIEELKREIEVGGEDTGNNKKLVVKLGQAPLSKIAVNSMQPRILFFETQKEFDDMVQSIKIRGNVQMPIIITYTQDGFMLIDGERRIRASRIAKLEKIFSIMKYYIDSEGNITPVDRLELLEGAMLGNLHQRNMTALEEARGYHMWIKETGANIKQCAERFGKKPNDIGSSLKLLRLDDELQSDVMHGKMTRVLGQQLASYPQSRQKELRAAYDTELLEKHDGKIPESNSASFIAKTLRKLAEDRGITMVRTRKQKEPKTHAEMVLGGFREKIKRMQVAINELKGLSSQNLIRHRGGGKANFTRLWNSG